ncbi:hypothetical protein ACFQX7_27540 [Luedemannella flava]
MSSIEDVERRITRALADLADLAEPLDRGGQPSLPPPYVRRHFVEHAAAGDTLNNTIVPDAFLPYVDPVRLRLAAFNQTSAPKLSWLPLLRRVGHRWDWHRPEFNDAALQIWGAATGHPYQRQPAARGGFHVRWSHVLPMTARS